MVLVLVPVPFTLPESTMLPALVAVPMVMALAPRFTLPERVSWVVFAALKVVAAPRVIGPANELLPSKF